MDDGYDGAGRRLSKATKASEPPDGDSHPPRVGAPELESCPVTPLGMRGLIFWYFNPVGELVELPGAQHNRRGLKALFAGDLAWCQRHFSSYDQSGSRIKNSWSDDAVGTWLMAECRKAGLFDHAAPVRSCGVWKTTNNDLIVHCGDVLIDGASKRDMPAGMRIDGVLYPSAPPILRPAVDEAGIEVGMRLIDGFKAWNFRDPLAHELLGGFVGSAYLGGAPSWRSHILVRAEHGSGKTWLAETAAAALGAAAHPMHNNYSEPGLRQALTGEARTLVLDEAESTDRNSRVRAVVELLRHMSSGAGSRAVRGSTGGRAQGFQVTGCAYLSAIIPPTLDPQDRSRITLIDLGRLQTGQEGTKNRERAEELMKWAGEVSPALRARAIARWPLFQDCLSAYRSAFLDAECTMRQADQFGTLLSGRDILLQESPPDLDTAAAEVERFGHWIERLHEEDESGEGEQCLTHLYTSTVDAWRSGERRTISEVILKALDIEKGHPERRLLATIGLRVIDYQTPHQAWLCVANDHVELKRIFADTRWANGGWVAALRYCHNTKPWPNPLRFAGAVIRATALPAAFLPKEDDHTGIRTDADQASDDVAEDAMREQ